MTQISINHNHTNDNNKQLLKVSGIHKSFGGNHALKGVDFVLNYSEVHAIIGENGAGKSTLIKIISGALRPDAGSIQIGNNKMSVLTPSKAFDLGIATIYQETSLYPDLSVAENLFVSDRIKKGIHLDWKTMVYKTAEIFERLGVEISPYDRLKDLGKGTAQLVEIGKALSFNAKILIMDEPTSSLSANETKRLFNVIRKLKEEGTSIIYISHRLEEVFEITDRIMILRDGIVVGNVLTAEVSHQYVAETMIGRHIKQLYHRHYNKKPGETVLEVSNLTRYGIYENISFCVKKGEIVALAGLIGSGRTEIARAVFGIDRYDKGSINFFGKPMSKNTWDVIKKGTAMIPEDRSRQGLILDISATRNIILASLSRLSRFGFRNNRSENELVKRLVKSLTIKPNTPELPAMSFSGGNQQKIVIGKWLGVSPKLLILDEPTCGVDISAKLEIYKIMDDMVKKGIGVLLVSSDFVEIEHMADRTIVMQHGNIVGNLPRTAKSKDILQMATMSKR